jgi:hypothetical protein
MKPHDVLVSFHEGQWYWWERDIDTTPMQEPIGPYKTRTEALLDAAKDLDLRDKEAS